MSTPVNRQHFCTFTLRLPCSQGQVLIRGLPASREIGFCLSLSPDKQKRHFSASSAVVRKNPQFFCGFLLTS